FQATNCRRIGNEQPRRIIARDEAWQAITDRDRHHRHRCHAEGLMHLATFADHDLFLFLWRSLLQRSCAGIRFSQALEPPSAMGCTWSNVTSKIPTCCRQIQQRLSVLVRRAARAASSEPKLCLSILIRRLRWVLARCFGLGPRWDCALASVQRASG